MSRKTIRRGDRGEDVKFLQLSILGMDPVDADGVFGPMTDSAARAWQSRVGLVADGIFGERSWLAAGELWESSKHGAQSLEAPACRAALRDASAGAPKRSKLSDVIVGDASHQARKSEHNAGNAVDITHDPKSGADCEAWRHIAITDPRTDNVIWNREIWSVRFPQWRPYNGSNPHTHHMHIEIKVSARDDASKWGWAP